jgi:hypothetical protein
MTKLSQHLLQAALNSNMIYVVYATIKNIIYNVVISLLQLNNSLTNSLLDINNTIYYDAIITTLVLQAR